MRSTENMSDEKRLLAFVVSEEQDQIFLQLDKEGIEILMRSLERIKKHLDKGELEHEHLFSEDWGGWELSLSDQVDKGKGKPIHHVKIYGWTDEWADKNGFDRTSIEH
jgi:hypothetical protein